MGFAGRFHYGRDICRGIEDCWNEEEHSARFMEGFQSVFTLMLLFMLLSSSGAREYAWNGLMKLFGVLNIEQSQSFFYTLF